MENKLKIVQEEKPWYSEGLSFKCTECGQCCSGSPGYTWVIPEEIYAIANFLKKSIDEFSRQYIRQVGERYSLLEHSSTYDCVFLKDKKCQIYPVRPTQCRTFPWWKKNLRSKNDWENAAQFCEGIRVDAPLISYEIISEQLFDF
jgi:uncharacterized protein